MRGCMRPRNHFKLFIFVTIAWVLFWAAGLPDYYQQYSTKTMILFDLAILPLIWLIIYKSVKRAKPGRALVASRWWAFYISFPLFIYDLLYAGIFLGHGLNFLLDYWYLTVYYILPWLLFPPTGWLIDRKNYLSPIFRGARGTRAR
jgi:hypothetical protein